MGSSDAWGISKRFKTTEMAGYDCIIPLGRLFQIAKSERRYLFKVKERGGGEKKVREILLSFMTSAIHSDTGT